MIGRDKEFARVIQILSRRTKINPCLIGDPGVGKTAIAEGIRREVLAGCEGSEDDVLLETPLSGALFTGYTRLYVPVVVSAPGHKSGEIVHVRLGSYDGERVRAEMV